MSRIELSSTLVRLLRLELVNSLCPAASGPLECKANLEVTGFFLATKIVDKLTMDKARLTQQRDLLKFVCREVWGFFFGKQADRLQTNKRGGYIIFDGESPWLRGCPLFETVADDNEVSETFSSVLLQEVASGKTSRFKSSADAQAALICGIIRGALSVLGFECSVTQDLKQFPGCSFHVTILG
eukprot:Protomagalhaensia_sp_Gyna_25__1834@NODE_1970_length_1373_cov_106_994003_g1623_i0_p1_GENE_NODE_1970_length_1373_cov_106_994003_g1623_i0NODE_1970_length_1373_cov_106_994003_g1623_i0_p1_ORF_typecomplete_len212_score30_08TRAPP/PF04051_16/3_3e28_NODE_1970_length_1373_cov_106_994003_g1623_i07381289